MAGVFSNPDEPVLVDVDFAELVEVLALDGKSLKVLVLDTVMFGGIHMTQIRGISSLQAFKNLEILEVNESMLCGHDSMTLFDNYVIAE